MTVTSNAKYTHGIRRTSTEMKRAQLRTLKLRILVYFINGRLNSRKRSAND